jgi:GNAT superfamily N-acetyltransferase
MTDELLRPLPEIRHLRPQEIAEANAVINAAFNRYLALIGLSTDNTPNPYDYLPSAVDDKRAWAALVEGELVGAALVDAISDTHWQIDLVGVLEAHAKAGIGRALMQRIETEARERRVTLLSLNTLEIAPWLWGFYQNLGFHIIDRAPPKHGLDDNIRVYMEKPLD